MKKLNFTRDLEIRYETDILIVGGGPAGVAAALAASESKCTVRLIEAHTCLGGMGTAGGVPAFMQFTDGINFLADGTGRQILDSLRDAKGTNPDDGFSIKAEVLKRVYEKLLSNAGVNFTYQTQFVEANHSDGKVSEIICSGKSGIYAIKAKVFIDCTGDGDLAVLAGAPFEKGDKNGNMMPGTLCSFWGNIDWETVNQSGLGSGNSKIEEAIKDGVFTFEDRHLPGIWPIGNTVGGGNVGHTFDVDGTDEESLTKAFVWGRESILEYEKYYKEYLQGFENMELINMGSLMGIRETRRIIGDYILNIDDFNCESKFDDEIGRYSYPVDIHIAKPDKKSYDEFQKEYTSLRLKKGESYGIPYRILTPQNLKNILVAGRCVSTDRQLQASIRVMPGCYITGQAAGISAGIMVEENVDSRQVDISKIQKRLKSLGAYLPNYKY